MPDEAKITHRRGVVASCAASLDRWTPLYQTAQLGGALCLARSRKTCTTAAMMMGESSSRRLRVTGRMFSGSIAMFQGVIISILAGDLTILFALLLLPRDLWGPCSPNSAFLRQRCIADSMYSLSIQPSFLSFNFHAACTRFKRSILETPFVHSVSIYPFPHPKPI